MRSNIARTWVSGRVPLAAPPAASVTTLVLGLERGDEVDQLVELLGIALAQRRVVRHRAGRVHQRARDRVLAEAIPDVRQVRSQRVAVLAHLVAAEASGGGHHLLATLELRRGLEVDL